MCVRCYITLILLCHGFSYEYLFYVYILATHDPHNLKLSAESQALIKHFMKGGYSTIAMDNQNV